MKSIPSYAQNFVPNYSFELLKKNPCRGVSALTANDNINAYVFNWVSPTGGTSDMHLNSGPDSCTANLDKYGLVAHSGNVCAGIFTLGSSPKYSVISREAPYREYLQARLSQKLTIGKVYYVELYVSPFDVSYARISSCYSNNIGCYFSVDSIYKKLGDTNQAKPFTYKPQVNEVRIMDKPRQWHKISGCFTATEAAQYITIGNFFGDQQTAYREGDQRGFGAYYFIDDVSVTETSLTNLPVLDLADTTLCPNKQLSLNLTTNPQVSYLWQDGSTSTTYTIKQAGVYSVTATAGSCIVIDTFRVKQEPTLKLPSDTTLCRGTSLLLNPGTVSNRHLQWSNGSNEQTIQVSDKGTFWVRSESPACQQVDSIQVNVADCPGTIPNVFTPNNDGINDSFFIDGITLTPWQLAIYNRWGRRVYKSEAYKNDWKGESLPPDVYYYLITSTILQKQFKGWVQLLR